MEVLTTGTAAKICGVAQRTVIKWFDEGRFERSYTLPGSGDRRIPRDSLEKFLREHGFPMEAFEASEQKSN